MEFTLFKIKFKISFLFFAVIYLMLFFDKSGYSTKMFLSILFHETGHIISIVVFGSKIKEVNLIFGTLQIKRDLLENLSSEVIISLFGPFVNLLLFIFFYRIDLEFSLINLVYFIINLIPIKMFDGGDILKIILQKFFKIRIIDIVLRITTFIFGIISLFLGFKLFLENNLNFSLLAVSCCLIISIFIN